VPYVLGSVLTTEVALSLLQIRFKKHRWHKKILKSGDPIIISMGWRRFQTIPIYAAKDVNMRNRMLKYTPLHAHCTATIFGPVTAPKSGVVAFQSVSNRVPGFRVAGTGVVLEMDKAYSIVKKLKLTGVPIRILQKNAFIAGMFTSELEVAKFIGSKVRTVSGIRGQIKKAEREPGRFRATFEDKISMKDIVFLRAWYPVTPVKFYNPMTSHHLENPNDWQHTLAMKSVRQLRVERGIPIPVKEDSSYKKHIQRDQYIEMPLKVPTSLRANLPFKLRMQQVNPKANKNKLKGLEPEEKNAMDADSGVVLEPKEQEVRKLLQDLEEIRILRGGRRDESKARRVAKKTQEEKRIEKVKEKKKKADRKLTYIKKGLILKAKKGGFFNVQQKS